LPLKLAKRHGRGAVQRITIFNFANDLGFENQRFLNPPTRISSL
jgi:hypothetical protein